MLPRNVCVPTTKVTAMILEGWRDGHDCLVRIYAFMRCYNYTQVVMSLTRRYMQYPFSTQHESGRYTHYQRGGALDPLNP